MNDYSHFAIKAEDIVMPTANAHSDEWRLLRRLALPARLNDPQGGTVIYLVGRGFRGIASFRFIALPRLNGCTRTDERCDQILRWGEVRKHMIAGGHMAGNKGNASNPRAIFRMFALATNVSFTLDGRNGGQVCSAAKVRARGRGCRVGGTSLSGF
jgi:hypothetical protein